MIDLLSSIKDCISKNFAMVLSFFVQIFIAYHVFYLSKKLTTKAKLSHKEKIKRKAEKLLAKIYKNELNSEVYLVNIKRYFKDYPSNSEKRLLGYSHIKAEIKSVRFNGIEFFASSPVEIYKKNGKLSFVGKKENYVFKAFPVGIVPYEDIDYIDLEGDEYAYVPLVYCRFRHKTNWKFWKRLLFYGYPYDKIIYYKESSYYKETDHPELKFELINQKISRK